MSSSCTLTDAGPGRKRGVILSGVPMSRSHKFTKTSLQHLADLVGEKLSAEAVGAIAQGGTVELAETFEIWFLGRTAVLRPDAPISQLARRTGYWHHQLRHNGRAQEY